MRLATASLITLFTLISTTSALAKPRLVDWKGASGAELGVPAGWKTHEQKQNGTVLIVAQGPRGETLMVVVAKAQLSADQLMTAALGSTGQQMQVTSRETNKHGVVEVRARVGGQTPGTFGAIATARKGKFAVFAALFARPGDYRRAGGLALLYRALTHAPRKSAKSAPAKPRSRTRPVPAKPTPQAKPSPPATPTVTIPAALVKSWQRQNDMSKLRL